MAIATLVQPFAIQKRTIRSHMGKRGCIKLTTPSGTISSLFSTASVKAVHVAQGLVTRIRIDDLRWFLLKWFVQMHLALVMIESESFRELIM
jgi:hypothetical protein